MTVLGFNWLTHEYQHNQFYLDDARRTTQFTILEYDAVLSIKIRKTSFTPAIQ